MQLTRRQFLELGSKMAITLGLSSQAIPGIAEAMEKLAGGRIKVLWLQGQSCSGCSISMIDSEAPGPAELMTRYISMVFHHTLSAATGEICMDIVNDTTDSGGHILIVEGSMPVGMPEACMFGHVPMIDLVAKAARSASHVIALGACAAFGGIPAAEGNQTGSVSVPDYLKSLNINTPTIAIPGCPSHPDWLVGTLVYLIQFGVPPLDDKQRPLMFFGKTNHYSCPRFYDYERGNFAKHFSDEGCLFELGCLGVVTYADCTLRDRNGGTNNCIKAGAPCVGCSSEIFALKKSLPMYRKQEKQA